MSEKTISFALSVLDNYNLPIVAYSIPLTVSFENDDQKILQDNFAVNIHDQIVITLCEQIKKSITPNIVKKLIKDSEQPHE